MDHPNPTVSSPSSSPMYTAPQIPNKYDVIPIHNSDRANFKRCRRYFDWTSPARQSLTLRADVNGVNTDLWFGTGIHYALEKFYTPGLSRDPVEAWQTWFDVQWAGGTVTEEWLDLVYDLNPRKIPGEVYDTVIGPGSHETHTLYEPDVWIVRGLEDIIPDPDTDKFDELRELGIQMMMFYKKYAEMNDGFDVIVAEHDFSVPVWDYENDCILTAIDLREQSPNYGKKLEVHSRGRMDGLTLKPSGKFGIVDHKTSARIDEEFFEKLDTDEQCTNYLYAAELEASYYKLPYAGEQMEEVLYNVLRKAYPKPPTAVRGGLFSVNRADESTTYDLLMEWIKANEIDQEELDEKHKNYISYVRDVGDEQFIVRKLVRRNRHQLSNAGYRTYQEAMDMIDPNLRIYPNMSNDFRCLRCAFRAPCVAIEDGSDHEQLIRDNYSRNRDR